MTNVSYFTGNNRGDWNHFKITQPLPEQHTRKARNSGHCTHTTESTNVKEAEILKYEGLIMDIQSIMSPSYFKISASFLITFLSTGIAISMNVHVLMSQIVKSC